MKLTRFAVVGAAAAFLGVLGVAPPASAHESSVSGVVECGSNGTADVVTWTILNRYPDPAKVTRLSLSPSAPGLQPPDAIPAQRGDKPGSVTLTYEVPAGPKKFTINYTGVWPDGFTQAFSGTVTVVPTCPPTSTAPAATPRASQPTLPVTGSSVMPVVALGGTLLALGGLLFLLGQRRSGTRAG